MRATPRLIGFLAVLAGLMVSASADTLPARPRVMKGGYIVLAADFHVHSFPGDGGLPPWEIAVEARRRRLDAVALTNHNSMHSWRLAQWLAPLTQHAGGAMLMPGEELTAVGFHLALVGITQPIGWRQSATSAAAAAHASGGVAIVAHPGKLTWPYVPDSALAALDGAEVAHPMILVRDEWRQSLATFYERAKRVHPSIAAIGSTDYHFHAPLGLDRTYVFVREPTQAGILDGIRSGRTVACDGLGRVYGPAELTTLVGEDCRRDTAAPPEGDTTSDRLATWLVFLGLVALVVSGSD